MPVFPVVCADSLTYVSATSPSVGTLWLESHIAPVTPHHPRNSMTHNTGKVADLGLSRTFEGDSTEGDHYYRASAAGLFPVKWTAPEAIQDHIFSEASDVWSFAVTAVEIFQDALQPYTVMDVLGTGQPRSLSNPAVIALVTEQGGHHPCPPNCHPAVYDVLEQCWQTDPHARPCFLDLEEVFRVLPETLAAKKRVTRASITPLPQQGEDTNDNTDTLNTPFYAHNAELHAGEETTSQVPVHSEYRPVVLAREPSSTSVYSVNSAFSAESQKDYGWQQPLDVVTVYESDSAWRRTPWQRRYAPSRRMANGLGPGHHLIPAAHDGRHVSTHGMSSLRIAGRH